LGSGDRCSLECLHYSTIFVRSKTFGILLEIFKILFVLVKGCLREGMKIYWGGYGVDCDITNRTMPVAFSTSIRNIMSASSSSSTAGSNRIVRHTAQNPSTSAKVMTELSLC